MNRRFAEKKPRLVELTLTGRISCLNDCEEVFGTGKKNAAEFPRRR
jgi:hypothetical protein